MRVPVLLMLSTALCCSAAGAPMAIHLRSTVSSPVRVGTSIGLSPRLENSPPGMKVFRYSTNVNGGPFHIIRDFSQERDFAWTPPLYEHSAAIRVTVRDNKTKAMAEDTMPFEIVSRVKGGTPVVTHTSNPLVALFSAPPCPAGGEFRVAFHPEGDRSVSRTSSQPCRGSISNNVWVAGMRADSTYSMRPEVSTGGKTTEGDWLAFHTGIASGITSPVSVIVPRAAGAFQADPVLIYAAESLGGGKVPFATDLEGRVIWYLESSGTVTRVIPGGTFLFQTEGPNSVNSTKDEQLLRELDLAGNILHETNAGRVGEQLESYGIHSDCREGGKECVSGFHHEALRLPNGHTLEIVGLERMMPAGTQGSKEPVDVLGDLVVDLDEDFQVAHVWNSFEHLDISRKSTFDAKCHTGGGGCPPVLLAKEANGWTHSNSLNYIPSTGDLLISIPEQAWVVKVDWKNGSGSGKILWRLGQDGDFKAESTDPSPWFSYAHDVGFEPAGSNVLTLMDNRAATQQKDRTTVSRVQAWKLDEEKMTATLAYNANLDASTICCGSSQILKNGGYSTGVGWIDFASPHGRTVETDPTGKIVYAVEIEGAIVYRSFRVPDLYSAPVK